VGSREWEVGFSLPTEVRSTAPLTTFPINQGSEKDNMLTLSHYLVLSALLFAISVLGIFLNRKNLIVLLMSIEMMLLAVNTNFVAFSHYLNDVAGQIFVFFILTVAAAEAAIGLAILVVLFRNLNTINVDDLDSLKG
jgi:NADH-quinone oxidoreductase subunit K